MIDETVEVICQKGCQTVRDDLAILKRGKKLAEIEHLNHEERKVVYTELKSIMAVYGDACVADGEVKPQSTKLINGY